MIILILYLNYELNSKHKWHLHSNQRPFKCSKKLCHRRYASSWHFWAWFQESFWSNVLKWARWTAGWCHEPFKSYRAFVAVTFMTQCWWCRILHSTILDMLKSSTRKGFFWVCCFISSFIVGAAASSHICSDVYSCLLISDCIQSAGESSLWAIWTLLTSSSGGRCGGAKWSRLFSAKHSYVRYNMWFVVAMRLAQH